MVLAPSTSRVLFHVHTALAEQMVMSGEATREGDRILRIVERSTGRAFGKSKSLKEERIVGNPVYSHRLARGNAFVEW